MANAHPDNRGKIILYRTEDGQAEINLRVHEESVWLTQREMAHLFATTTANVTIYIKDRYKERGQIRERAVKDSLILLSAGGRYCTEHRVAEAREADTVDIRALEDAERALEEMRDGRKNATPGTFPT